MTGALTSPSGGVLLLHGGEECCSMRVAPAIKLSPEQRKERPGDPEKVYGAVARELWCRESMRKCASRILRAVGRAMRELM